MPLYVHGKQLFMFYFFIKLIDQQKVEKWYKSVENTINEELKTVNMFWLEISLPTRWEFHISNFISNLDVNPSSKQTV